MQSTSPTTPAPLTLGALILGDIPGYTRQSNDLADTGPTDLDKATLDDVGCNLSCDARGELTSAGFVHGWQREWVNLDAAGREAQNFVFLYQFKTPTGAQRYAAHWRDTLLTTNQLFAGNPRVQVLNSFVNPDPRKITFSTTVSF